MSLLTVKAATHSYGVHIDSGLLAQFPRLLHSLGVNTDAGLFIVTDRNVEHAGYAATLMNSAEDEGRRATLYVVEPGDASKSLATVETIYQQMALKQVRRQDVVVALGGGVIGDLAGFVAATYLRGLRFIQVPTTLLAHDSSVGGKVGVNLQEAKNLVGAFYPPIAVIYDVDSLRSLPNREWVGGMAEVIKHGVIADAELFDTLERHPVKAFTDAADIRDMLTKAVAVKVDVVEADERESGRRMTLNVGHTIGHAVEQYSHYDLHHGECVAIGMRVEAELAVLKGWCSREVANRIVTVLAAHGLPVDLPPYPFEELVAAIQLDKKHDSRGWTFALPKAIGMVENAFGVPVDLVKQAWQACGGK